MITSDPVILAVDDDPNDLELIAAAANAEGVACRIKTVVDGSGAIAYLMGEGKYFDRAAFPFPTFIITDLKMREIDGFALIQRLKENPEWAMLPTAVLSGSKDNGDIRRAYLAGASSYHVKPASLGALRAIVKALCDCWILCEVPALTPA